jgi:hypothetical protein
MGGAKMGGRGNVEIKMERQSFRIQQGVWADSGFWQIYNKEQINKDKSEIMDMCTSLMSKWHY